MALFILYIYPPFFNINYNYQFSYYISDYFLKLNIKLNNDLIFIYNYNDNQEFSDFQASGFFYRSLRILYHLDEASFLLPQFEKRGLRIL